MSEFATPPSLLFVIKSVAVPGGGAERVLRDVASEFVRRGRHVVVASFDGPPTRPFYSYDPAVEFVWLGGGDPFTRTNLFDVFQRTYKLRRLLKTAPPAVAIGFLPSAYLILALAALGTCVPVIGSEHNVYRNYARLPLRRTLLNMLAPALARITAVSDHMRSTFPEPMRDRMTVVLNPIGRHRAKLADVGGGKTKVLLTVGRLHPEKDQACLVNAFARLAPKFPDWRLRIVGEGEMRTALQAQIRALGVSDQVDLPGVSSTIDEEYASAQLFCLPSRYESQGLATAEALSHGLPVVGFADCPGTNELVEDGVNGLLVEGEDRIEVLAAGLKRLMASPEDRRAMGGRASSSVREMSVDRAADQWEELLNDCLNLSTRPPKLVR